jgi:quinol monooxygenase YgiN
MTQEQAIQRGFTHFIEVWRNKTHKEGYNQSESYKSEIQPLKELHRSTKLSKSLHKLYTVAIFLIKPKLKS